MSLRMQHSPAPALAQLLAAARMPGAPVAVLPHLHPHRAQCGLEHLTQPPLTQAAKPVCNALPSLPFPRRSHWCCTPSSDPMILLTSFFQRPVFFRDLSCCIVIDQTHHVRSEKNACDSLLHIAVSRNVRSVYSMRHDLQSCICVHMRVCVQLPTCSQLRQHLCPWRHSKPGPVSHIRSQAQQQS